MRYAGIIAGLAIAVGTMGVTYCAKAEPMVEREIFTSNSGLYTPTNFRWNRPPQCYGIPWCACYLADKLGLNNVRWNKNRATEWGTNLAKAAGPALGVIVVWARGRGRGHVGQIVGGGPGNWIVHSGNVNNRIYTGVMNLRGAVFRTL